MQADVVESIATPTVTAIVPTFNRAHFLGRALRSVIAQTFQDWECLVVDDGSVDDTEEVVEAFDDSRIRYIRHGANRGAPAARNTGLRAARGEFLAFLDSDDEWVPEKLEKQVAVFEAAHNPKLGAVICGRTVVEPSGERRVAGSHLHGEIFRQVLTHGLGGVGSSILVHRSVLDRGVWFDESFPSCQDRDFMVQVARSFHVESIAESLVQQHREHGDRHLWSGLNAARGLDKLIVKYLDDLRQWPEDLSRLHKSTGISYLIGGDRRAALRHLLAAYRHQPLQLSCPTWILITLLSPRVAHWIQRRGP